MYQISVEVYRDTYRIVDQERYTALVIIIIIFIYRGFTTSAQPDIPCMLFKTYLPKGPHLYVQEVKKGTITLKLH